LTAWSSTPVTHCTVVVMPQILLVQPLDTLEVLHQLGLQGDRQHGHAVLPSLAVAYGDLVVDQVHVLDPQPEGLRQPQSGSVEERKEEPLDSFDVGQNRLI
jgi:hypothetical protein